MSERTQTLMMNTPIKSLQVSRTDVAKDARAARPGMNWKLGLERARLLTESYRQNEGEPMILRRAKALAHILENMTVYIRPGELIVGNFSSTPDSVNHYPELAWKWVERETSKGSIYKDLLTEEERKELKEIDIYWERSAVHHIFKQHLPEELTNIIYVFNWECATPNYEKIFRVGLKGIIEEAKKRKESLDRKYLEGTISGYQYVEKRDFLDAVTVSLHAAIRWSRRYVELARGLIKSEKDPKRKYELEAIAKNCEQVPENPPRTLQEALQCYWFIHLIVNFIELPMVGDGIRFDKCFNPFYEKELKEGRITREQAQELVECIFVKSQETGFLHPPIWSGAGGGALGFQTITIGGTDSEGKDITNEMTYIVLDAMKSVRTVTPPLALRWHEKMPERLINKTIEVLATGMPQPAIFNDKVNVMRLVGFGISLGEAREYSINNCMVPTIPGKNLNHRSAWANAVPLPKCLNNSLGVPEPIGEETTAKTADPRTMRSIEELIDATIENYKHLVKRLVLASKIADKLYEEYVPRPFLSAVLDDSIERAQDVREWNYGPEYRDIVVLGLNNTADSLAAIKKLVFEEKKISMEELIRALENNWEGYEDLRRMCLNAPKFGNDDDYVDLISSSLARRVSEETEKFKTDFGNSLIVDGTVASAFWLWGRLSGPTADGRKRGDTFHDGSISPIGGNDRNGPTAVLKSASKVDPLTTWNHLLNQSFIDQYLKGHDAELFAQYLKTWADLGIHHIQFSVVDRETLIDAQRNPSQYSNLMVRVCGYSAYFVDLAEDLQNSIIARTPQCLKA